MADYKLKFTAAEIDEKLSSIGNNWYYFLLSKIE